MLRIARLVLFNCRVTVERQTYGLRLRIRNLTRSDQGMWECLGSDQEGRPLSRTLQINVKGRLILC